jgi:hypothetical protein
MSELEREILFEKDLAASSLDAIVTDRNGIGKDRWVCN